MSESSPTEHAMSPEQSATVRRIAEQMASMPGALLPILHEIQSALGFVPSSSAAIVADALNISRADVHGVVSFYHLYRTSPPGQKTLYICRAEACQSMGGRDLAAYAQKKLAIDFHETTADGKISLEPIFCLGNCACAPAVMVDSTVHGRVTPDRLDAIIE